MDIAFGGMFLVGIILLWLVPIVAIAASNKTHGAEKAGWILATLFISWFAWIVYLIVAPVQSSRA
ncbi:MAG: hypothetical protein HWE16_04920 [Gammaproteobacteria bacterium]|nr:hypothetical protein [Gammaproteobacteria bacterium]